MVYKRCAVEGCGRTKLWNKDTIFFSFPTIQEKKCELSGRRREIWLQRVNITEEQLLANPCLGVCDRHFILGKPCFLSETNNLDWAPSQHLTEELVSKNVVNRFLRAKNPSPRGVGELQKIGGRGRKRVKIQEQDMDTEETEEETLPVDETLHNETHAFDHHHNNCIYLAQVEQLTLQNQEVLRRNEELERKLTDTQEKASQLNEVVVKLQQELDERLVTIQQLELEKTNFKSVVVEKSKDLYTRCLENPKVMKYYTRFSPAAFEAIFNSLLPVKHHNNSALDLS